MITLEEAEAVNRAARGQFALIVVAARDGAHAKFSELRSSPVAREFEAAEGACVLRHRCGGRCVVLDVDRLPDGVQGCEFHFAAIADGVGPRSRSLIQSRVRL